MSPAWHVIHQIDHCTAFGLCSTHSITPAWHVSGSRLQLVGTDIQQEAARQQQMARPRKVGQQQPAAV